MGRNDICVLGLGYVGLPTASIFAARGRKVLGVDVIQGIVETINRGGNHINEPDLDVLVQAAVHSGNLRAALVPEAAATFIIAVPTPFRATEDNPYAPDLRYVEAATRSIAAVVDFGNLIILESTSPVGTTESVRDWLFDELGRRRPEALSRMRTSLLFAHCPERILPGQMLKELVANDRIAGGLTPEASEAARELYHIFCVGEIFVTDARTAEMCKLTENASRDVAIAFANELSVVCERLDIDVWKLIKLANRHPRVQILQPGPGVGGHCIAVDPWFIVSAAPSLARLIRTAREVNDAKPYYVLERVKACAHGLKDPVIACLGLTFKADVNDLRGSPALEIVTELITRSVGKVLIVEPHICKLPVDLARRAELVPLEAAIAEANIILLLVDHREFLRVNHRRLKGKVVIDTRGVWH